jgi:threonylcarbamoyladenosine tRNA methylthiotransferase MtaB
VDFAQAIEFARLHIFRYSPRAGTSAAAMRRQVPSAEVQERSQRLHTLNAHLEEAFRRKFVGRTMPVLWESHEPFGFGRQWSGLTGNYLRVVTQTGPKVDLRNQVLTTNLVDLAPAALQGSLPGHALPVLAVI